MANYDNDSPINLHRMLRSISLNTPTDKVSRRKTRGGVVERLLFYLCLAITEKTGGREV